jgi:DNA repair exonuclease SbcCD ATPase subunit
VNPSGSVFADATTPTPKPPVSASVLKANAALSSAYKKEQDTLPKLADQLTKASGEVTNIQALITKAQSDGVDATILQNALATFQVQLGNAQNAYNNAASILSSHAGFDDSGTVTDPTAAHSTVVSAGKSEGDAQAILNQAVKDLHSAIASWHSRIEARVKADLKKDFDAKKDWSIVQSKNLDKANAAASQLQDYIARMSGKGMDVSGLQSALSTFQGQIAQAQTAHGQALSILSAHNGFSGGNVTDIKAARETVQTAGQALSQAHDLLVQSTTDLRNAIQAWKAAHPSVTEMPALPAPNNG